jgi:cyclase
MRLPPSPPGALPTVTFTDRHRLQINGENIEAGRIPPAHTDTDAYIRFERANVLHLGDVFFSGMYPFIDVGTGGNIEGQIAGANLGLSLSDNATKIVAGHGPVADKAALTAYRDMLVTARDRVTKLKAGGRTLEQVVAARPTADLDETWGKGFMQPADFVALVYGTLP